jgi:putative ABC transport system permease protein
MHEWIEEIRRRLAGSKLEPAREAEIVEELSQHLEDRYAESLAGGATPEESSLAALAELRESESLQQELHQVEREVSQEPVVLGATRRINMLGGVWQDLRYGARMLAKTPGFTLLAVLTLALGIGANTAIFSGVNAMLFRPMPATLEPERLCYVKLEGGKRGKDRTEVAYAEYEDFQARSRSLEGLAAYMSDRETEWLFDGQSRRLRGEYVSGNYFQVLGAAAALGRVLTPEDEAASAENAVVVSDGVWRQRFAADPGIIGKQVLINDRGFTIVGVTAAAFRGPSQPFAPAWWIAARKEDDRSQRIIYQSPDYSLIGRLKPGFSPRQAQAELAVIFAEFKQRKPAAYQDRTIAVEAARGFDKSASERDDSYTIMGAAVAVVGLTLLIACANIASFLLARARGRRKEIAVRLALGASRWRIMRMLLAESLLLAGAGAAAAAAMSFWATDLLSYALSLVLEGLRWDPTFRDWDLTPDRQVFGATVLLSLLVSVVCGLAPALQASKPDLTAALKDEAGLLGSGFRRLSWRNALVVAQVAGALVLLAGSVLFLRSARQALRLDMGFEERQLAFNEIELPRKKIHPPHLRDAQTYRGLQSRVAALPLAQSVCLSDGSLLEGRGYREGFKLQAPDAEQIPFGDRELQSVVISPNYFATVGIPLTRGRDFAESDLDGFSPVVIINETIARRAFPEQNPVGRQIRLLPLPGSMDFQMGRRNGELVEIIGVAKDAVHNLLGKEMEPILYLPLKQNLFDGRSASVTLIVRTRHDPSAILPSLADQTKSLDPEVRFNQSTLAGNIARQTLPTRIASAFFGLFGALGLLLAAIGLAGVLAYAVASRTKEIGIRMALGADRANVLGMIIGEGFALTSVGVVIGLSLALALTRALASYLYGISAADPLTYLATTLLLIIVGLLACYFPARRAANVDPMTALRQE